MTAYSEEFPIKRVKGKRSDYMRANEWLQSKEWTADRHFVDRAKEQRNKSFLSGALIS